MSTETPRRFSSPTVLMAASLCLTGCATVMNSSTQPIKIETRSAGGEVFSGADCTVVSGTRSQTVKSGDIVFVPRSSQDMDVSCVLPGHPVAVGRVVSRANAAALGNIVLGGPLGAVADHGSGAAYSYPSWLQLVFGQTLVFDRAHEQPGQPNRGTERAQQGSS